MYLIKRTFVLVWYLSLHASFYIFFMNLVVFYAIFYNNVTTLLWRNSFFDRSLWKLHSICKIRNKRYFVREIFLIFGIFIRKITVIYQNHLYCPVTLYTSPSSPLGRTLGWVLLGPHLSHTWGYFFNTKTKQNKNNIFYLNWRKPGSIEYHPSILGPSLGEGGSSTRAP